jgi:osmotically-inducible protein OsmY
MKTPSAVMIVCWMALSGCSTYHAFEKCGPHGCPGDAEMKARVEEALQQAAGVQLWEIHVQSLDHVIYLDGLVDTELQRSIIESVAYKSSGRERIVNSIAVRNNGR